MNAPTLNKRQLNRALLSRQMLLAREMISPGEAVERLVGLQSQIPNPPYIGLWTRLRDFQRETLTQLMEDRQIVRAAMMRSTLHLVTAMDHQRIRPTLQPALDRALRAFYGKRAKSLDVPTLVAASQPFIEAAPRTTGEIRDLLKTVAPDQDGDAMAYAVRNNLPQVQVPPGGTWGAGTRASYTTAASWIGPLTDAPDLRGLLHRYLVAFGPASVMDFQAWTGMTSLKKQIAPLTDDLVLYQSEDGKELLDLPGMSLPDPDTPAPVRFIPEYDNLLVSHADRTRVIADEDRGYVFLSAARVLSTILVDGFVAGTWKATRDKDTATLTISPFAPITADVQDTLQAEGASLLRFIEDDAATYQVVFADKS